MALSYKPSSQEKEALEFCMTQDILRSGSEGTSTYRAAEGGNKFYVGVDGISVHQVRHEISIWLNPKIAHYTENVENLPGYRILDEAAFSKGIVQSKLNEGRLQLDCALLENPMYAELYRGFSKWTTEYAKPDERRRYLENWVRTGANGAAWLVRRLTSEHSVVVQEAVSEALLALGAKAVPHVIGALAELVDTSDPEPLALLLSILGGFEPNEIGRWRQEVVELLGRFLGHPSSDVREASYNCTEILNDAEACKLLDLAKQRETDARLRHAIQELREARVPNHP